MDFRLRVFVSVADNFSFTKASRELNISQPAISKHIQELENQYGVKLFQRLAGRVELSPKGEILYRHAQRVLREYDILKYEMDFAAGELEGVIVLGTTTDTARMLMKSFLPQMISKFPKMQLSLITGSVYDLENSILEGKVHFALFSKEDTENALFPETVQGIERIPLEHYGLGYIATQPGSMTLQLQKLLSFAGLWYNCSMC